MRAAQLYIKDSNKYIQLGQDADFPFTLSKSIAEIQDVSKRNKTFSKTFKIPATEDNISALGYAHVIGTDLDAINVYKQECLIIVNGNVIDEGFVYILKARRNTNALEFECQFVGGNEAWVVALQSLKMSQIFAQTVSEEGWTRSLGYNDTNVIAKYNTDPTTLSDPRYIFINPYMYMFSDRAVGPPADASDAVLPDASFRNAKGTDFWPAFRLDYLIEYIFSTATDPLVQYQNNLDAFELDSDFFQNNSTHGFWSNIYYSDRSLDEYPDATFDTACDWGDFLPTDLSCLDFFMQVVKTFNLVFTFDGITLKVEPRQDWKSWNGTTYTGFYSGDIDWSEKVSVDQEIEYKTSNYKRQIRLTYEKDNYPITAQQYPFLEDDTISQPELRYVVDVDNNNEEGVTDIVLPFNFSPSKFYQGRFDHYRSHDVHGNLDFTLIGDALSFNADFRYSNRLFVFKVGSKPCGVEWYSQTSISIWYKDPRWRNWVYRETDGTLHYETEYPFIYNCMTIDPYHGRQITFGASQIYAVFSDDEFDEPKSVDVTDVTVTRDSFDAIEDIESNSIDDINLGVYKSNTIDMVDGLYERFWKTTIDQLVTTRTLVSKVLMSRNEFVNLDISKYYTLMGQRFILNKVKDFDPMLDEQMVEVELLAVDAFRSSDETEPPCVTLSAVGGAGTQTNIITGTSNVNIVGRGVELQRGRYIYILCQAANADNQTMTARGITQSSGTLTNSASTTTIFNADADFDPYARGQAMGMLSLNDTQAVMIAPQEGIGNVFKVCTYDGGTNNVTIDFTVNDGDTANYVDRVPNFAVINTPSQNVYTIASVGLTRSGAFPYARVWDLDTDAQTITSRGILYPMGVSGSGNGQQQLVNLGTVGGKHCFAIFYAKQASSTGVLYYAVYEYNSSTNTLVEVVGDTLYKSGSNHCTADIPWKIEDGKGIITYLDRVAFDTEISTCIWNGTTLTIGTPATFGNTNERGLDIAIRKYYDVCGESTTKYLLGVGLWSSGTNTGDFILFPAFYDPDTNTWDVTEYNTANSDIIIEDPSNPSGGRSLNTPFIGLEDNDNGAVVSIMRTMGNNNFRGVTQNTFTITNS